MLLEIDHICKSFGAHQVLTDVTFDIDTGEVVGILGANGAGKTTLLRIINHILQPDSGHVLFNGRPIVQDDLKEIGYLPEERGLYRQMRAGEQAIYLAQLKGMDRREAKISLQEWFERWEMAEWWDRPVKQLSKGMQQRLQFVVAVAHNPKLLVLDEPFSGFDNKNAEILKTEIQRLRDNGTAILLSTHNLQASYELCNKTIQL